ncbi:MAG TPA: sulfatase-like hydrolase/transferase [Acidobacteriota bacterium]|nr:sulfatase-like hydrolase/transferase [Acidobacteriota bacterium]
MRTSRLFRTMAAALLCCCSPAAAFAQSEARPESKTDVILITIDTLRADRLGCYGYQEARTPHIDKLAKEGVRFERAFSPVPLTLPAHTSLLTGTYPPYHGVRDNAGFKVPDGMLTLAEVLSQRGYSTAAVVGSYVLDSKFGLDQGFDHYYDEFDLSQLQRISPGYVQRSADEVVDEALRWLNGQSDDRPVFLWVHLYDPHDPYQPPQPYASNHPGRPYDGEIEFSDAQVGRLLEALRQQNRYQDAVIALAGDHGESLGEHGEGTHGFFIYNSTLQVPLIIRLPQGEQGGRALQEYISLVDVFPTLSQILRLPRGASAQVQGEGRFAAMLGRGRTSTPQPLYAESYYPRYQFGWSQLRALILEDDKYILSPSPELFDLEQDFQESDNLAGREQALANSLSSRLREFTARISRDEASSQAALEIDPETQARLQSLGYAAFSRQVADDDSWRELPAPREKIDLYNRIVGLMELTQAGRHDQAIAGYRQVLEQEPELKLVRYKLGQSYFETQRYEQALEEFKKVVGMEGDNAPANFDLAMTYMQLGRLPEASAGFELVLKQEPEHVRALSNLAVLQRRQGLLTEALEKLEKAHRLAPADVFVMGNLGASYSLANRHQEAIGILEKAVSLEPENALLHANLASAYGRAGNPEKAQEHLQKARTLNPSLFQRP